MELFRLLGRIVVSNTEANEAMDDTVEKGKQTQSKLSSAFEKMGSFAAKAGKVIATGIAVGATAIGTLAATALSSYADYEQLIGGVETLYGTEIQTLEEYAESVGKVASEVTHEYEMMMNRQDDVMENARQAYKTAGMSVNEYMETVNGFAASLTSSLGEYEWQAAGYADMIVTDMADNANKMGTSMESIQNAYSGFAKQNYTMLDNLKLGYGGTKEEMERLLRDAEEFGGYVEGSLDVSSFADVAEAINLIQTKLGITGTTAKEASATISGSVATMKAAWTNLVIGFGDDQADLSALIDELVSSAITVADNVIPRIQIILSGVAEAVKKLAPKIAEFLPSMIESLLPSLIEGAVALITGLASALPSILKILIEQIPFIVTQIAQALVDVFPILLQTVKDLFGQIWDYISLELLNTGVSFQDGCSQISAIFADLWAVAQTIWSTIGQPIWDMISFAVLSVVNLFAENMPAIQAFAQNAFAGISDTWENHLKPTLEAIGAFLNNVLKPAFEFVFSVFILPMIQNVFSRIGALWTNTLKPILDGMCDFLTGVFTLDFEKAFNGLLKIAKSIFNGITDTINSSIELAKNIVSKGVEKLCELFDFDWELPKIKLPHFSIKGSFSLNPPSIPSFGVEWYKNGGIMTKPTAFGINPGTGKMMVGGEAGAEAIAPIATLQKYIREAMNESGNLGVIEALNEGFNQLMELLLQFLPQMANMQLVMDSGAVVGEIAPQMDAELGRLAVKNERGV